MKIGIDVRLQNESGVGRYIRNLTRELKIVDKNNKYILLRPPVKWHSLSEQLLMPFYINKAKTDLMHFPYFNVPIFYFGKFIVTIHDLTISSFDTGRASTLNPVLYKLKRVGYKIVLWNAIHRAEKIIAPTKFVKKQILNKYNIGPDKVIVTYEGVDKKLKIPAKGGSAFGGKSRIKPNKYFLYVGNAYPHKNLEILIQAAPLQTIKLVLVGKEDYFYKKLRVKVKEMNLSNNVVFTGQVTDPELSWLYQNANALVFPSLMEGFGLPALEAMANGCLVLASDIPALREVCKDAALYFNPKSVPDLVDTMEKVVQNPEKYKDKIKLGKKRAAEFSWNKAAQKTLKAYENSIRL